MTKRQLIDEIVSINPTAEPGFLARFEDGQLDEYLCHLRVLRTPRLTGNPGPYEKYFPATEPVAEETDAAERAALLTDKAPDETEYQLLGEIDDTDADAETITEPDQASDQPDELQAAQLQSTEETSRKRVRPWRHTHAEHAGDQTLDDVADQDGQIDDDRSEEAFEEDASPVPATVGANDEDEDETPSWLF